MEILTEENLVGAKTAPTGIPMTFTGESGFLTKDFLLPPRIRWKVIRRWRWGSHRDPDSENDERIGNRGLKKSAEIAHGSSAPL